MSLARLRQRICQIYIVFRQRELCAAVYPPPEQYRKPEDTTACPKFGKDSVLTRPDNAVAEDDNVCPGQYRFESNNSSYNVTWWDPKVLDLGVRQSFGIRQEELLAKGDANAAEQDLEEYQRWHTLLEEVRTKASTPTHVVRTATSEARRQETFHCQVDLVELPRDVGRPGGARFGTLVHSALATVPLDANPQETMKVTMLQGRILGATDREVAAASKVVQTVLSNPLLTRAKEAWRGGACRREVPITLTQQDGCIVEGVLDLAFREKEVWTVVDFKTDQELANEFDHYRRQVEFYCMAVVAATSQQCSGILMHI